MMKQMRKKAHLEEKYLVLGGFCPKNMVKEQFFCALRGLKILILLNLAQKSLFSRVFQLNQNSLILCMYHPCLDLTQSLRSLFKGPEYHVTRKLMWACQTDKYNQTLNIVINKQTDDNYHQSQNSSSLTRHSNNAFCKYTIKIYFNRIKFLLPRAKVCKIK